ncbi:hypothetical protein ACQUSR_14325 [Streptomyces sp. P1-3]|uniref:hypothetical protein n=1 Tax=Streptomyces sp. P1-3 TaxID=3421658 RepID=UPI003D35F6E1
MPTPHGPRGGMAFSADELRVLRRALAIALQPTTVPALPGPGRTQEVQECLRLARAVDAAVREGGRMRAFLLAELARYRAALPGAAPGYVDQLRRALAAGYLPLPEDLAALRRLCAAPSGAVERARRRALLSQCERVAERRVRAVLADRVPGATVPSPTDHSGGVVPRPMDRRDGAVPIPSDHSDGVRPIPSDHFDGAVPSPADQPAAAPRVTGPVPGGAPHRVPGAPAARHAFGPLSPHRVPGAPHPAFGAPAHRRSAPSPRSRAVHPLRPGGGRLLALPGGLAAARGQGATGKPEEAPRSDPKPEPRKKPEAPERKQPQRAQPDRKQPPDRGRPGRGAPSPGRPVPTPAEVFPPKRRPAPPAGACLPADGGGLAARTA